MSESIYLKSGTNYLSRKSIEENIVDVIDVELYQKIREKFDPAIKPDLGIQTNEELWSHILSRKAYFGQNITLNNFFITEWLPFSPGLFHTPDAKKFRERAARGVVRDDRRNIKRLLNPQSEQIKDRVQVELDPNSKRKMVFGGIGTLRLVPKIISGTEYYFLGASSSGVCHEGIPLILSETIYHNIINQVKENSGLIGDITARLKILPSEISSIKYDRSVPKYCLFVEDIKNIIACSPENIFVSTAITYSGNFKHLGEKSWSFISFNPDSKETQLKSSVEWLYDYAKRYSNSEDPIILSDFDEYHNHFDKVELPLYDITNGKIPIDKLIKYKELLNIEVKVMGDNFSNITNSTIINRSYVENAFNKVKGSHDEETAMALATITKLIEESNNTEAGEVFDDFNEELNKDEPKKSRLNAFWNQLNGLLPSISSAVGVVEKITAIIA